ncbi:MAG TPA: hypothetical protein PKE13_19335 [Hyphomicrobium zavarzinii]|nr:hypothetical protein [Hyphomicrobium zavarzinii]
MAKIDLDGNAPLQIEIAPSDAVNPRLKFQVLGGEREAGDVGPANTHVPIPNWDALQSSVARGAGVRITKNTYGNMPKSAYGRVMAAITRDKKKSPKKRTSRLFMGVSNVIAARGMTRDEIKSEFKVTGAQVKDLKCANPFGGFDSKKLRWIAYRLHIGYRQQLTMPSARQLKERLRRA